MHKLNGESLDIVDENINKLKELFPEIVNEDNQVDLDALQDLFEKNDDYIVDDNEEHYKFTWWGKKNAKKIAKEKTTKTLKPSKKDSKNWDDTNNIYIEGDNLDAIKILLGSYRNRVKMIYIDPPYNTGKDFIYKDNFHESQKEYVKNTNQLDDGGFLFENAKTDGKFHSNWLNMIYSRLYLARKLLTDDGIIFISIDDQEVANLRKVCDEIFGEANFIRNVIWEKKYSPANDSKVISDNHDHILIYCKNMSRWEMGLLPRTEEMNSRYVNKDDDSRGRWKPGGLSAKTYNEKYDYPIRTPSGKIVHPPSGSCWQVSKERLKELIKDNRIYFGVNNDSKPQIKQFLSEVQQGLVPKSIWKFDEVGHNQISRKEITNLFGDFVFDTPKPINLIDRMIRIANLNDDDYVFDFFSGSASTAHAVLKFNLENQKKLKFIMVQSDDKIKEKTTAYNAGYRTLCQIGEERIRRAGDKILEESDNKDLDIGFKVFKVDESNFIPWNSNLNEDNIKQSILSTKNNLVEGRSELDLIYELILKLNLDLNSSIEEVRLNNANMNKIYVIEHGFMFVCLDNNIDMSLALDLLNLKKELKSDYSQVILMDNALNDELSININETLSSNNVKFYTI